jgi:FMN phosphatase YigB (HAD superfamily)
MDGFEDDRSLKGRIRTLKRRMDDALMVGDAVQADYEGARAVGMRVLHLDRSGQFFAKAQTMMTLHMLPRANDFFR